MHIAKYWRAAVGFYFTGIALCGPAAAVTPAGKAGEPARVQTAMIFGDVAFPQDTRISKTYFEIMRDGLSQRGRWNVYNYRPELGFQYEVLRAIHMLPLIDDYKPDVVVYHFSYTDTYIKGGTNGYEAMTDAATFKTRLTKLVRYCTERKARVILLTPVHMQWNDGLKKIYGAKPPFNVKDPDGFNAVAFKHIEAVREVAREQQVELLDVYEIFRKTMQANKKKPQALMLDSIRMNNDGHKLVGKKLVEMILKPPQPPAPLAKPRP